MSLLNIVIDKIKIDATGGTNKFQYCSGEVWGSDKTNGVNFSCKICSYGNTIFVLINPPVHVGSVMLDTKNLENEITKLYNTRVVAGNVGTNKIIDCSVGGLNYNFACKATP